MKGRKVPFRILKGVRFSLQHNHWRIEEEMHVAADWFLRVKLWEFCSIPIYRSRKYLMWLCFTPITFLCCRISDGGQRSDIVVTFRINFGVRRKRRCRRETFVITLGAYVYCLTCCEGYLSQTLFVLTLAVMTTTYAADNVVKELSIKWRIRLWAIQFRRIVRRQACLNYWPCVLARHFSNFWYSVWNV
jgi:hypothetical protein